MIFSNPKLKIIVTAIAKSIEMLIILVVENLSHKTIFSGENTTQPINKAVIKLAL